MNRLLMFGMLLLASSVLESAAAQDKGAKSPGGKAAARVKAEQAPGYKILVIEGFTVLLGEETVKHLDDAEYKRKPLEVVELELKTLVSLFPAKAINVLRNVLIWVEWDEKQPTANGRPGRAVAVYYGGHQAQMLAKGKNPLKARNVTVLSMKALTEEHQPGRDQGRCVLLHEIAHAVHDQLVGFDNPAIKAAYKQALERKLYDANMYASTNEAEFFAELTCSYFDQLAYYPKKRDDLKKHDPATYKVMESVWGKSKTTTATKTQSATDLPDVELAAIDLGKHVLGPKFALPDLEGKPVLVIFWNVVSPSSLSCFSKVAAWDAELRPFGLTTIAVHLTGQQKVNVEETARGRDLPFAVTEGRWTDKSPIKASKDFPLAYLFDHEGKLIFQGSPFDAVKPARSAVGQALVSRSGVEDFPKALAPLVDGLRKGQAPASIVGRVSFMAQSRDTETADAAKLLLKPMLETGRQTLSLAESLVESNPLEAFLLLERLPTIYKDTEVATRANEVLNRVKMNKSVVAEQRARTVLAAVKKLDTELNSQPGSFDPKSPEFRARNRARLGQLQDVIQKMTAAHAGAKATEQAIRIGDKYGVSASAKP
jgi:hypothetical protein